uniref:Metal-dependent protease of the PAD1/JAB1 superfamily-like protein n=1 Tax=Solibacter usitatus (strain Ellin6076) TaxID=234267 RepID=Q01Y58_SOLUE
MLAVTESASRALTRACDEAHPMEACGFLLGSVEGVATEVIMGRESAQERDTFAIPDHELRRVAAYAQDRGLRILALFHSHPSGSRDLSRGDRAALRYSAWPWVIVTRPSESSTAVLTFYAAGDALVLDHILLY